MDKKKKDKSARKAQAYAHNPAYCMIRPDADEETDVVSTGSS